MSLTAQLDTIRSAMPGCVLAAYGDSNAKLVLRSSADRPWPQERLDDLCKTASRTLDLFDRLSPKRRQPGHLREAVVARGNDVRIYVGAPAGDLLCCVCRAGADTQQAAQTVRAALAKLMGQDQ